MSEKIIVLHPENQPEVDIYPIIKEGSIPNSVIDNQKIKSRTIINSNIALNTLKYEVLHQTLKNLIDSKITQANMENYLSSYYYNVEETQQYVGSEINTLHQTIQNEFYSNTVIDNMLMEKTDLSLFRQYLPSTYLNLDKQQDNQTSKLNIHANGSIFLTNSGNKTNSGNYYLPNSIVKTEDAPNGYFVLSTTNDDYQSLYNLGAYDKITTNSDGTYTITRQTGYVNLGTLNWTKAVKDDKIIYYTRDIANYASKDNTVKIIAQYYKGVIQDVGFNLGTEECSIDYDGLLQVRTDSVTPKGLAQYKLATSYTEKVEKNHYATYNQKFILEHNKSEAERSANVFNIDNINPNKTQYVEKISDTEFKATWANYVLFKTNFKENTQYTISGYVRDDVTTYHSRLVIFYTDNTKEEILIGNGTSYIYKTHTSKANKTINYISHSFETGNSYSYYKNLMINEGTTPLPYQSYEGKTIHEKDLENTLETKQDKLVSGTNIKKINGNDILGSGNITLTADSVFTKVEDNVTSLTISKSETYLITTVETYVIHVVENENINFYGSALVTTTGMLGGNPHININGVSYPLSTNTVTLTSGGLFKAYKLN